MYKIQEETVHNFKKRRDITHMKQNILKNSSTRKEERNIKYLEGYEILKSALAKMRNKTTKPDGIVIEMFSAVDDLGIDKVIHDLLLAY